MDEQDLLRNEIFNSMNERETDELVDIWQEHDTSQWTELAFEVVKEILWKRLGSLPQQDAAFENKGPADEENAFENVAGHARQGNNRKAVTQSCPNCRGRNLFTGELVSLNNNSIIALKTLPSPFLIGEEDETEYSEIVALACDDCGHVFFMLKEYDSQIES